MKNARPRLMLLAGAFSLLLLALNATGTPLAFNARPTPAQAEAIHRAAAGDFAEANSNKMDYAFALADLNDDGRPDLLAWYRGSDFCGGAGCAGVIVLATPAGYAEKAIALPYFQGDLTILPTRHHGMHDLQFGDSPVWQWSGGKYAIPKADLPGAKASAWTRRQAPGHALMAMVVPIGSSIAHLRLFCGHGAPLLAMRTRTPLPPRPLTLTFVFRGWTVNVPMQPSVSDRKLWVANVADSDLPLWLAHRGRTAATDKLARLADASYLRIDGGLQGQISLADSARSTRAALSPCYRY